MRWTVRSVALASAVGALAGATPANAAEEQHYALQTAEDLGVLCAATSDSAAIHMCHGYLIGVNHMHRAIVDAVGASVYCVPDGVTVTRDSAAADYATWISENTEAAGLSPREGLLRWASIAFPCE
ncbi:MAG: Rap1a/Tai family immunity protein [Paracoccaceae bacterium]|mgnify:CR=1 FL=1